jgi:hypothetical protein
VAGVVAVAPYSVSALTHGGEGFLAMPTMCRIKARTPRAVSLTKGARLSLSAVRLSSEARIGMIRLFPFVDIPRDERQQPGDSMVLGALGEVPFATGEEQWL